MSNLRGRFVVFDGPDGSGKSTQFARFAAAARDAGLRVCEVREPGGTSIGEQIRTVLLDPENAEMALRCEMLLYMASRAQLVEETVCPALDRGELVLADRFISSTLAYQGTAGGLDRDEIMSVGDVAVGHHWPHLVVIFDVDEATRARRLHGKRKKQQVAAHEPTLFSDRIERKEGSYHERVRQGYLEQAQLDPEHYLVIDARADEDAVFSSLMEALERNLSSSG
ncbi:MAG: dTMP kinase [Planctomycetota bacterium]